MIHYVALVTRTKRSLPMRLRKALQEMLSEDRMLLMVPTEGSISVSEIHRARRERCHLARHVGDHKFAVLGGEPNMGIQGIRFRFPAAMTRPGVSWPARRLETARRISAFHTGGIMVKTFRWSWQSYAFTWPPPIDDIGHRRTAMARADYMPRQRLRPYKENDLPQDNDAYSER